MKLFTDVDLDGFGCGVLAKLVYNDEADVAYCSYRNLNHRVEQFIESPASKRTIMYITDLAVNEQIEKKLEKRFKDGSPIQMLDHHVTALHFNEHKWAKVLPKYENGKLTCATSLFYDHLVESKKLEKTKAIEEFVDLIRQFDTWEWDANNNIKAKQLNDLFYIMDKEQFEEAVLKRLKESPNSFILNEKETILLEVEERKIERYIHSKNRQLIQAKVDEYLIGFIHAEQYLSELGNALNKYHPHLDMIVLLNMGGKKVGFRTIHDHVDVSEYATRFGGGGHPKASGCEMTKEAFEKFVVNIFPISPIKLDPERNEINIKEATYGTSYENQKGEFTYILPTTNKSFEVIHNKRKLDQPFETFWDAERFVKRNYESWLRYDTEYIPYLCRELSVREVDLRGNFKSVIKKHLDSLAKNS